MEKKILDRLIKEGQRLSDKRSWLKKGFNDLFEEINLELGKIPDMDEDPIVYTLLDKPGNDYDTMDVNVVVKLYFENDAYMVLRTGIKDYFGWKYKIDNDPTIEIIREFGKQLGFCLRHFLEVIEGRNKVNQQAIEILSGLLKKLA